jgi:hypothetical protein
MRLELKKVEAQMRRLHPLRRRALFQTIGLELEATEVTSGQAMFLWAVDYLTAATSTYLVPDQQQIIIDNFCEMIVRAGDRLGDMLDAGAEKVPDIQLMIAHRQFATMSGTDKFINLTTGEILRKLTRAPFEVTMYNLTEIFIWNIEKMKKGLPKASKPEAKDA